MLAAFARTLAASLRRLSGRHVTVSTEPVLRTLPYATFEASAPQGALVHVARATGLGCPLLVVVPPELASGILELQLGGERPGQRGVSRAPAAGVLGRRLVQRFAVLALDELGRAFPETLPVAAKLSRQESVASHAGIMQGDATALLVELTVAVEGVRWPLTLVLPQAAAAAAERRLRPQVAARAGSVSLEALRAAMVELEVRLGSAVVTAGDLLRLDVGDVLVLDQSAVEPLEVFVEGVSKLTARPGVVGGHRAVKIVPRAG